jgi:hypothetical protein
VFHVRPLAARERSNTVGNLLSVININSKPMPAPALPRLEPVTPQTICTSSINPGGGLTPRHGDGSTEPEGCFQRLANAAIARGWRVYTD